MSRPKTEEELLTAIREAVEQEHDYESSAEALVTCAVAAFNYAVHKVGASGFQASHAALRVLGEINHYRGPYGVLNGEDLVYPQYNVLGRAKEMIDGWMPWAADRARELLADPKTHHGAPEVRDHWVKLAQLPGVKGKAS